VHIYVYTYIHAYTYTHSTKQTYVSGISLLYRLYRFVKEKETGSHSQTANWGFSGDFRRIGPQDSHRLSLPPLYTYTHTQEGLQLSLSFLRLSVLLVRGPEPEPDH
jgi:hypothetical protein